MVRGGEGGGEALAEGGGEGVEGVVRGTRIPAGLVGEEGFKADIRERGRGDREGGEVEKRQEEEDQGF